MVNVYNEKYKHRNGNSTLLVLLRLTFACLSLACFFQILQQQQQQQQHSSSIVYVTRSNDGGDTSDPVQSIDLDAPMPQREKVTTKEEQKIPKFEVDPIFQQEQKRIDSQLNATARCTKYGVSPLPANKDQRRIFFGSMLANENAEVIVAHAIEVYNKYDVVAFVESNTTHYNTPRALNYGPGSIAARTLQESELFGPSSKVIIDYWLEDEPGLDDMDREVEQRNVIWKTWIAQGMTRNDLGIMADLDEVVSRDFLNALRECDFPKLRNDPENPPTCQTPKMALSTMQFESSPLCVKRNEWFHPDIILGNCVLGVGDPSGRAAPHRRKSLANGTPAGLRAGDWGKNDYKRYPQDILDNKRFPLWDGRDIREINGNDENLINRIDAREMGMGQTAVHGTGYHFHNWFKDLGVLRHKYATYGHGHPKAERAALSDIQGDLDMLVRCVRGLGNQVPEEIGKMPNDAYEYYTENKLRPPGDAVPVGSETDNGNGNMFTLGGNRPIFFLDRAYVEKRHALIEQLIRDDESKFGSFYKTSS